ncbi:MAG: DNA helicase II, partial [Gammaproteobacteria bacterium]
MKKGIYDAILVDEGQDFATEWMQGLSQLLNERSDSLLFCYDPAQNVFGRKKPNWKTAGFKVQGKKPTELKKSYRNTVEILQVATRFCKLEERVAQEQKTDNPIDITLFPDPLPRHGKLPI